MELPGNAPVRIRNLDISIGFSPVPGVLTPWRKTFRFGITKAAFTSVKVDTMWI